MRKLIYLLFVLAFAGIASAQWEPDVRLTNATGNSLSKSNWSIAANANVVHTVWYDYRDGNSEIYYKRSTDGGVTWGADTRLTNDLGGSMHPTIAVINSIVHITWSDSRDGNSEIYYKSSADGGITWGADTRLTNNTGWSGHPSIAISGSIINVVWYDERDGNSEIYYKRSSDGGINWGPDTRLTNNISISNYPCLAVSGLLVHVVWEDFRDGNREIYYKRSTDGGLNWEADTRLSNTTSASWYPSIAVFGSNVHVVWEEGTEIYCKLSTDGGINWGADTPLTNYSGYSGKPSIAIFNTLVHVVWEDERDGNKEIYYKRSSDGGTTWGMDTRLSNNVAESLFPSISISDSLVHVVWHDGRDGNPEIYYKRNPTGNSVGINIISTEIPSQYSLGQNYPNPFNPTTKIKFAIPLWRGEGGRIVTLKIYDIMGREVQTLVNEALQPGTYEATFDARRGGFTSGIYFYRLETNNIQITRKCILLK